MPLVRIRHIPGDELVAEKLSKRTYTRTYLGVSDTPADDPLMIRADPLTPKEGEPDAFDRMALNVAIRCKRRPKTLKLWDITVTSTTEFDAQEFNRSTSPLDAPTVWSGDTVLYEVPITKDINGKLIANKAGDVFEGAMTQVVGWTFTAKRSIPYVSLDWIDDFVAGVNDSTVNIRGKRCAEKTVWLRSAQIGEPRIDFGIVHCPSTFIFEYNPLGWYFAPLNRGFREQYGEFVPDATGIGGTIVRKMREITDDNGRPVTSPVFLNNDGELHRIPGPNGTRIRKVPLDPSDIITLKFEIKQPVSFRRLGVLL